MRIIFLLLHVFCFGGQGDIFHFLFPAVLIQVDCGTGVLIIRAVDLNAACTSLPHRTCAAVITSLLGDGVELAYSSIFEINDWLLAGSFFALTSIKRRCCGRRQCESGGYSIQLIGLDSLE